MSQVDKIISANSIKQGRITVNPGTKLNNFINEDRAGDKTDSDVSAIDNLDGKFETPRYYTSGT